MTDIKNFTAKCFDSIAHPVPLNYAVIYDNEPKSHKSFGGLRIEEQAILSATGQLALYKEDEFFSEILNGSDNPTQDTTVYFIPTFLMATAKASLNATVQLWMTGQHPTLGYVEESDIYIALCYVPDGMLVLTADNGVKSDAFYDVSINLFNNVFNVTSTNDAPALELSHKKPYSWFNFSQESGVDFLEKFKTSPLAPFMPVEALEFPMPYVDNIQKAQEQLNLMVGNLLAQAKDCFISFDLPAKKVALKGLVDEGVEKVKKAFK